MVSQLQSSDLESADLEVIYPECDGQPMANNTEQFRWIVVIQQNLDWLFADRPDVFVAGDLFWYPVEGRNDIVTVPDVMLVMGRPKGKRGSYKQWEEESIAPQVLFEILSPGNTQTEMDRKLLFYDHYGVEEYYLYDPEENQLRGFLRRELGLDVIEPIANWVSPRLAIRFDLSGEELQIFRPDGQPFLSYAEIAQQAEASRQQAEAARQQAEAARRQAAAAEQRAEVAEQRAARLAEQLRSLGVSEGESLGIDPEQV